MLDFFKSRFLKPRLILCVFPLAGSSSDTEVQPFGQFIADYEIGKNLVLLEKGAFPPEEKCTAFKDKEPYKNSIASDLALISSKADSRLVEEAMDALTAGIQ